LSKPIFGLSGFLDPIVPWCLVRPWLRRYVPSLRAYRVIASADHNVLGTAPEEAASQVLRWIKDGTV
jgi:pimeloyl-ACP methyl ester carboxylesterase